MVDLIAQLRVALHQHRVTDIGSGIGQTIEVWADGLGVVAQRKIHPAKPYRIRYRRVNAAAGVAHIGSSICKIDIIKVHTFIASTNPCRSILVEIGKILNEHGITVFISLGMRI